MDDSVLQWPFSICQIGVRFASDHSPLVLTTGGVARRPLVSFRFLDIWSEHADFNSVIQQCWGSVSFSCNWMQTVMNKLKAVKKTLIEWNKNVFGNVYQEIEFLPS